MSNTERLTYEKPPLGVAPHFIKPCVAADALTVLTDRAEKDEAERDKAMNELDALHERMGGELPKQCKNCELWGKSGWSQHDIGYCEGDDHPRKGTDFCNRWSRAGKENDNAND